MANWKKLGSRLVYSNKWMNVKEDSVINPAGERTVYGYYTLASKFLNVVPIDEDGNTYIVRQYRYPLSEDTWEFVAGQSENDSAEVAARRELLEEAGLETSKLTKLGEIYADSGVSSTSGTIFLAEGIKKVSNKLDKIDGISRAKKLPFEDVKSMIVNGDIHCPHTISAYFMTREYLKGQK